MLTITIPGDEYYNEKTQEFEYGKTTTIALEHSLVSISKWESKWHKPFISKDDKTQEEVIDYIKCMTITQNVDPQIYYKIPRSEYIRINKYIDDPMTATTVNESPGGSGGRQIITSELIYYWMISLEIPFECQKWHLNRLLMLIRVCNVKNNGANNKKMSKNEIMSQNKALNAARRKKLGSKG